MSRLNWLTLDGRLGQMLRVLDEVSDERRQQHRKWGEQNCTDFEWVSILTEEVGEAAKEVNDANFVVTNDASAIPRLRKELIQVAAVAVAWVEAIDRRREVSIDHSLVSNSVDFFTLDRSRFPANGETVSGLEIRKQFGLDPSEDRVIWETCPGANDREITDESTVKLSMGLVLFTTPRFINNSSDSSAK